MGLDVGVGMRVDVEARWNVETTPLFETRQCVVVSRLQSRTIARTHRVLDRTGLQCGCR